MATKTLYESISLAKQKENEIFRLNQLRKALLLETFVAEKYLGKKDQITPEEYNKKLDEYISGKSKELNRLDSEIDQHISAVIDIRNKINKANVETGLDKLLVQMKWMRIRLDIVMKELGQRNRNSIYDPDPTLNYEFFSKLGIGNKLKELETAKNELDGRIQKLNFSTTIEI